MNSGEYYRGLISPKEEKLAKYREFEKLVSLVAESTSEIGQQVEMMASGAAGVKEIINNWELVLESVSLASSGLLKYSISDIEEGKAVPEPLIRIKLNQEENKNEEVAQDIEQDVEQDLQQHEPLLESEDEANVLSQENFVYNE